MNESPTTSATSAALSEALDLSSEILKNIELGEIPLTNIALKASRLARLLNDLDYQKMMAFEASGYPSTPTGVTVEAWRLGKIAGRRFEVSDEEKGKQELMYVESIEELEEGVKSSELALSVAKDPDISISSANPNQWVDGGITNQYERQSLRQSIEQRLKKIARSRALIHEYALRKHYELKYSNIASDVFSRVRSSVDDSIGLVIPDSVQKFASVYENLRSDNPEDWANAVHSCRRVLQDLADAVFPPQAEPRVIGDGKKQITVELGPDNYVNRIICFVDDHSSSDRFTELVGSHIRFLGDRLDAVFRASQKGSHGKVTHEEADRYVVYTYLVVGDILTLKKAHKGSA